MATPTLLKKIEENFKKDIKEVSDLKQLADLKVTYLGRKQGALTDILKSLKNLPLAKRRKLGPLANKLRQEIEKEIAVKEKKLKITKPKKKHFDITAPGIKPTIGRLHVLTRLQRQIEEIFKGLGFEVVEGPEVETEFNNFDALNIPPWHPARNMWQTFWLEGEPSSKDPKKNYLLRTHTSPVQIRYMTKQTPPFRIIAPGRCFRYEATDASHNFDFYQLEGLMVSGSSDPKVTLSTFKAIIEAFLSRLFKTQVKTRLTPSFFPFVEPGVEVHMRCVNCRGRGCSVCQKTGWVEIMGAGMVHPKVFEAVGYNPRNVQGFAFGVGIERLAMMKYKINDIRLFYSSDMKFLKQF
jgi:phenylalanyl-tRNA synthetase alpha chain